MAAALGRPLMPWQRDAADVLGEYTLDDDGVLRLAYRSALIVVPRRAGKTALQLATALQRQTIQRDRRGWYTAQTREDAAASFRDDWVPILNASPVKRLFRARMSNGSESLRLRAPGALSVFKLFAPGPTALHGKDADDVTADEAWAFDLARGTELEAGIRPAMATRSAAQFVVTSAGGTDASTWLAAWRARAQAGARGLFYLEYSADPDDDLDDPATLARVHPAVGFTVDTDTLWSDRDVMPLPEWQRSYLGVWTGARAVDPVIPWASWNAAGADYEPGTPPSLAFAVAPDGAASAIAASWRTESGRVAVEIIDHRPGTAWVPERLETLSKTHRARVAVDRHGPAAPVADDCRHRRIPLDVLTMDDYATACAAVLFDVTEYTEAGTPRLSQGRQPVLDAAVRIAGKRPLGDRWAWARGSGDITALEAATVAAWAARKRRFVRPVLA